MEYQEIQYAVAERILTLTLHRPDKLNAFTARMLSELLDAIDRADADDDVRAVIFTGAGRAFCAGADLSSGSGTFDARAGAEGVGIEQRRDGGGRLTLRLYDCKKPLIAAINGPAVGVGVTMTLPMDVRMAASDARFGFVFARRGICMEAASSWFLPRVVGVSRALEWTYTGRVFPASEALEGGLVRSLHPPAELLPAARGLAREIADNTSAISVAMTRQLVWKMLGADHPMEAHKLDSRAITALGQSADAHEGVGAFLEKRKAEFRQRPSREMPAFFPWWKERRFE
ncbi:MAG TPA: crotonase/enoyl-CoA hydratase family protein [Myxococcota bacterium]|nr:crotonase/enoyl-CoA hydratase family protein [Myxococcota bacterium]